MKILLEYWSDQCVHRTERQHEIKLFRFILTQHVVCKLGTRKDLGRSSIEITVSTPALI